MKKIDELKSSGEAPSWMDDAGYSTLRAGYLLPDETPKNVFSRR
jgi:hypothetical protein